MRKEAQGSQQICTIMKKGLSPAHSTEALRTRISSVVVSRLMINLRDPELLMRNRDNISTGIGPVVNIALETLPDDISQPTGSESQFFVTQVWN